MIDLVVCRAHGVPPRTVSSTQRDGNAAVSNLSSWLRGAPSPLASRRRFGHVSAESSHGGCFAVISKISDVLYFSYRPRAAAPAVRARSALVALGDIGLNVYAAWSAWWRTPTESHPVTTTDTGRPIA